MRKTFEEFMHDKELAEYSIWMSEEKRKKKSDLEKRMSDAYQKRQRQKKISKLQNSQSHWVGLS